MISFEPLFQLMKERNLSFYDLTMLGVPHSNAYRIKNSQNTSLSTLDILCRELECEIGDIIQYVPDPKQ